MRALTPTFVSLVLLAASTASAQMATDDDRLLAYSGYLQDGVGPVSDLVTLRVVLFTSNSTVGGANDCVRDDFGNCGLWREELVDVVVSAGRFSVVLGETVSLIDTDLASNQLWVALGVKGSADIDFAPLSGRQQLIPVPYASRAAQAKDYKVTGTTFLQGTTNLQGQTNVQGPMRVTYDDDVDIGDNAGSLVIGDAAENIGIDGNEIMARSADDTLYLQNQGGVIYSNGALRLNCSNCGGATLNGGDGWGNLTIQGRVISTNSALHLSPPAGYAVVINDSYRAAGGSSAGEARLEVQGPIHLIGSGDLRVRVDGTSRASTGDINPEVYQLNSTSCTRGDVWVGRPSGAGDQDALCACLLVGGNIQAWCFNP
jgi:hypothetical protein